MVTKCTNRKLPFCNKIFKYCPIINIVKNYKNSFKLFFATRKCFFQLQTSKVDKYKLRMSLQLKMFTTCQYHNNSHYVPLLTILVAKCSTNLVEGCCQLPSHGGWTSSTDWAWHQQTFSCNFDYARCMQVGVFG
jgi:hypothetical protein